MMHLHMRQFDGDTARIKLDSTLIREIRAQANGDGGREARFAFIKKVRGASKLMSAPDVIRNGKITEAFQAYGRAAVAICFAATLYQRRERLDFWGFSWATEVLKLWKNRPPHGLDDAYIDDGIHPTSICDSDYAGSFIRLTAEEPTQKAE